MNDLDIRKRSNSNDIGPFHLDDIPNHINNKLNQSTPSILNNRKRVGDYILGETLGAGSFGKVKLATHINTGEKVAIKIVSKDSISDIGDIDRIYRETFILTTLKHNNIIKLYEVIDTAKAVMLVMEFADSGELLEYIAKKVRLNEVEACKIFHQILSGLEYCHRKKIIHRDLKLENILMNKDGTIKIADFGLSNTIRFGQKMDTACGTPSYTPPEMIQNKEYSGSCVDIWSLGVILFALVSGYLPFESKNSSSLFKKIAKCNFTFPNYLSNECKDIISSMLTIDSEKRADINRLRSHKWFLMEYNGFADELDLMPAVTFEQISAARIKNITSSGDLPTVGKLLKERQRQPKLSEVENKPSSPVSLPPPVESPGPLNLASVKAIDGVKRPSSLPSPSQRDLDLSPFNFNKHDVKKDARGDVVYNQVIGLVPPPLDELTISSNMSPDPKSVKNVAMPKTTPSSTSTKVKSSLFTSTSNRSKPIEFSAESTDLNRANSRENNTFSAAANNMGLASSPASRNASKSLDKPRTTGRSSSLSSPPVVSVSSRHNSIVPVVKTTITDKTPTHAHFDNDSPPPPCLDDDIPDIIGGFTRLPGGSIPSATPRRPSLFTVQSNSGVSAPLPVSGVTSVRSRIGTGSLIVGANGLSSPSNRKN